MKKKTKRSAPKARAIQAAAKPATDYIFLQAAHFTNSLIGIFSGARTPLDKMVGSNLKFDETQHRIVGRVHDSIARELFNFCHFLSMQLKEIPIPQTPKDTRFFHRMENLIQSQLEITSSLAWQRVYGTSPGLKGDAHVLLPNWEIAENLEPHDSSAAIAEFALGQTLLVFYGFR